MSSTAVEEWHAVEPQGLAGAILGVTIAFTILCLLVVGLRVYLRLSTRNFGREDWLMCVGTTINMVHNGIVIWGCYTGIGTRDSKLNTPIMMEGAKAIVFWQIFYVSGSVFIKASICAQLIRISTQRRYKIILYLLIVVSIITTLIAILAVLIRCKPVSASWNPTLGTCIDQSIIIALTASIATIIRMPYSSAYSNSKNLLYNVGNIILWTVVECGLGIIAGSMPMLRKLVKGLSKDESTGKSGTNDLNLVTIGRIKGKHHPIHDTDIQITVIAGDDAETARDDDSTKRMIRVMKTVNQTTSQGYREM
ncbi:hypothetical protein CEP51_000422 [Fusarium floridanum]|uniref:Rhodopsin domain-containing protein n=1 Tax=Fusarium floridanum TaxID=1325733 RepID=A0A428SMW7_9HYPO|nr:hypothetical protein CEP51_000422 [Fusarium floridanum]